MSQINFMPWVKLDHAIVLGPTEFAPWSIARVEVEADVRNFVDRCFARYVMNDGTPMSDVTVAVLNGDPTMDLTDEQRRVIQRSVDVMAFAAVTEQLRTAVCTDHGGLGVSNSERFQLVTQRLGNLDDYISVVSGGYQHGWRINDVHFCLPWCAGSSFVTIENDIAVPLSAFVHDASVLGERLGRALEWFRLAHTGNEDTSELSRIVMMATAYEILLDPDDEKRKGICKAIDRFTAQNGLRTAPVRIGGEQLTLTMPAVWFDEFYRLRNAIVHGDSLHPDALRYQLATRPLSHRVVGTLVLWEVVMWLLYERGDVGQGAYGTAKLFSKFAGEDEPESEFVRYVASSTLGIDRVHRAFGWQQDVDQ